MQKVEAIGTLFNLEDPLESVYEERLVLSNTYQIFPQCIGFALQICLDGAIWHPKAHNA